VAERCRFEDNELAGMIRCREPALGDSQDGYCLLHSKDLQKDKRLFRRRLTEQVKGAGENPPWDFTAYVFPAGWGSWPELLEVTGFPPRPVCFRQATFQGDEDFGQVIFNGEARFTGASFNGQVSFYRCRFNDGAIFDGAEFGDYTDFTQAQFRRDAVFARALFHRDGTFYAARFHHRASFREARFEEAADFRDVQFNRDCYFDGVSFESLGTEGHVFSLLSKAWERMGNRERADKHYHKHKVAHRNRQYEMVAEKLPLWHPRRITASLKWFLEWLLADATCAYGTSWKRVLLAWAVLVAGFAAVFWLGRGILRPDGLNTASVWQSLYFSIVTFSTLGYGDFTPTSGAFQFLAGLEALSGAFMMALFVAVFGRQFMR